MIHIQRTALGLVVLFICLLAVALSYYLPELQ